MDKRVLAYIMALLCTGLIGCLIGIYFYALHSDSVESERRYKEREAKLNREMEDWHRQQREAFHFDAGKFLDSFIERNGEEAPTCPVCGGDKYDVLDKMAMIRNQKGMLDARGYAMPCAVVMCRNCGRAEFFVLGGKYADVNKKNWLCDKREECNHEA